MTRKKICMLGAFGVGKTSLVSRFVESTYSDAYLTTVGVKIDKKVVDVGGHPLTMMLWDLAGKSDYTKVQTSHLRGASAYILVVDGTRLGTFDVAVELQAIATNVTRGAPFVIAVNKFDVADTWEISLSQIRRLEDLGWRVLMTSAKTGYGVDEMFQYLGGRLLAPEDNVISIGKNSSEC